MDMDDSWFVRVRADAWGACVCVVDLKTLSFYTVSFNIV